METEFHFDDEGKALSVVIGQLVNSDFHREVMQTDCIKVLEYSKQERGWTEDDGFEICINYDDDISYAMTRGPFIRYGPIEMETGTKNGG